MSNADAVKHLVNSLGDARRTGYSYVELGSPSRMIGVRFGPNQTFSDMETSSALDLPVIPIVFRFGSVLVGPLDGLGMHACSQCASRRRSYIDKRLEEASAICSWADFPVDSDFDQFLSLLVAECAASFLMGGTSGLEGNYRSVETSSLSVSSHSVLQDPLCPRCGTLEPDSSELAVLRLQPRAKLTPQSFRSSPPSYFSVESMEKLLVDSQCGLVAAVTTGESGGMPAARAELPIRGSSVTESGWGRSTDYLSATRIALLEAVERWGGLYPGRTSTAVYATYDDVRERAVFPPTLGLHDADDSVFQTLGLSRFDEHVPLYWVWGYNLATDETVLVPESYAYYGTHLLKPDAVRLAYEVSNGCAVGANVEEAVLHGLFEVIERDSLLAAWYSCRPLGCVDIRSLSCENQTLHASLEAALGMSIHLFDATTDVRVPAVWALALARAGAPSAAASVSAGSASLDVNVAATGALRELGPIAANVSEAFRRQPERALSLVEDSNSVLKMDDHTLCYAHPQSLNRLHFLTSGIRAKSPVAARHIQSGALRLSKDLRDDIRVIVEHLKRMDLQVIVVDQTTSEHNELGVSCVKVIVPGTLPMTFGHASRRITGLRRFDANDRPQDATRSINPFPHPFP